MFKKNLYLFLLIVIAVYACGNQSDPAAEMSGESAKTVASKPIDGEKIYKTYCVTCHGIAGDMGASGAANLQDSKLSLEERIAVITNGRNLMNSFKSLMSEEKIKAVATYTMSLSK
mgnify:CR=1 FL=1